MNTDEGVDGVVKGSNGVSLIIGWDTDNLYLPAISVTGRLMRGLMVKSSESLAEYERAVLANK